MARTEPARFAVLAAAALMVFSGAQAAERATGLKLAGDKPIQIESDKLEVKEKENTAVFTGNVAVTQGDMLMKSGRMVVYYAKGEGSATTGSAAIDKLEVDGKVYLKSATQVATGDAGVFDMKTEVMVLTGSEVVLSEGDNVIVGCKLTVQMKSGKALLDGCGGNKQSAGRVKMLITPDSAKKN